jgi:MT0933-like antitoxin protein
MGGGPCRATHPCSADATQTVENPGSGSPGRGRIASSCGIGRLRLAIAIQPTKGHTIGLSDKLKNLGDKAKESAAEHREQITNAVETAGVLADKRTRGKYSDKIAKAASKTEAAVDKFAGSDDADGSEAPAASQPAPAAGQPAAATGEGESSLT